MRGYGEGSIYRRPAWTDKRGRVHPALWVVSVNIGSDSTGKRVRRRLYATSEVDARAKLREAMRKHHRGELVKGRRSRLQEYLVHWLKQRQPTVRPATFRHYVLMVGHLEPLSWLKLEELRVEHVQELLNRKAAKLSARSLSHLRAVLRNALEEARRRGLLVVNVATLVRLPTPVRLDLRILSAQQAQQFLASVSGDRLAALYLLALHLGMRLGELLGLRWEDVDLAGATIMVRKALQRIEGELRLVVPKSRQSRRTIPLSGPVVDALLEHQRRQAADQLAAGPRWKDAGFMFASPIGRPLDPTGVSKAFRKALTAAGPTGLRFHDLRHSCTSLLLHAGNDPRTVADILGHSQVRLTLDTYAHTPAARQREALEGMGRLLSLPKKAATPMATPEAVTRR